MIKKILINFLIISLIIALFVTNYKSFFEFHGVFPDLLLILTVLNGIFIDSIFGMFFGFFAGLTIDIMSYNLLGFYSLIYAVIGYFTSITKIFNISSSISSAVFILILNLLKALIFFTIGIFFLDFEFIIVYFRDKFLIEIIYTTLVSFPIFLIYKKLNIKRRKI